MTLGIIGGMGPLSTAYFYEKIVKLTNAAKDQDHLDIIIYNKASIPDRTDFILGSGVNPLKKLIKTATDLQDMGATYLAMPCNTAHFFYDDMAEKINIPFINMIEETAKLITRSNLVKEVLLLSTQGTIKGEIYPNVFNKYQIDIKLPCANHRTKISDLITSVKKGDLNINEEKVELLKSLGKDHIVILGCTELSVVKNLLNLGGNFIDPLTILAENVILFGNKKLIAPPNSSL